MSIFDQVNSGIKEAMKAHDKGRLEALRGIKAEFLLIKTAPGNNGEVSDENAIKVLVRMAKQRKESAQIYIDQQRQDLADVELLQASVIEEFLPKQMNDEELTAHIKFIIEQAGATSMKDMGKVMGVLMPKVKGRADGKMVNTIVKSFLQG